MKLIDFGFRKRIYLRYSSIWLAFLSIRMPSGEFLKTMTFILHSITLQFLTTIIISICHVLKIPIFVHRLCNSMSKESMWKRTTELQYFNTTPNKMRVSSTSNSLQIQLSSQHQKITNSCNYSRAKNELFENGSIIGNIFIGGEIK